MLLYIAIFFIVCILVYAGATVGIMMANSGHASECETCRRIRQD